MNRHLELARLGSNFDRALADAIAQQDPAVAQRLLGELHAGNYEIDVTDDKKIIVKIAGSVVLEAQLYAESADVRAN